ncbi:uncharacterized protein LOC135156738 [Lytechinus pictus]|uniref:uncharacterized protein LOC135156738 n=1 Tax=Lytechinus pictus TaxID=7653 RepID=UPI0030B9BCED
MPKKGQKYVKKRKGFNGIPWQDIKKARKEENQDPPPQTASERKLKLNNSPAALNSKPGPTHTNPRQALEGNYIISGPLLAAALQKAHVCPGGYLIPLEDETKRRGLNTNIVLRCSECGAEFSFMTSENVFKGHRAGKSASINRKAVLAASEVGLGRVGLADLSSIMGLAPPPEQRSYQRHLKCVATASDQASEEQMKEAAKRLRDKAREEDPSIGPEDIVDVAVSYDGTWHKRGHTSNHGVGVVISLDTGEVLDREVLSKVCKECNARKGWDREGDRYKKWKSEHECYGGHSGSSGAMEAAGAKILWSRAVTKHKLRYKYMLGDGDSSAFKGVEEIYGDGHKVHKIECVGHVGKRMYKALDKYRKDKSGKLLSDGKRVGHTKGRLRGTSDTLSIGRLSKLYRATIRSYSNKGAIDNEQDKVRAVEKMRKAILAILYHSVKMRNNRIRHQYCPKDGWCEYKKTGKQVNKENHLDNVFLKELLPTFTRLSNPDLLERCLPGITQNQNESFNALIWKRCPKHLWRGPRVVRTAVNLAVLAFNCGAENGRNRLFRHLRLPMGARTIHEARKRDYCRLSNAKHKSSKLIKKIRELRRKARKTREQEEEERDGGSYETGAY